MSGGGGTTSSTSTTDYGPAYDQLLGLTSQKAQDVANLPLQQYQGDQVANLSPDTLSAFNLARSNIGSTDAVNQQALDDINQYGNFSGLQTGIQALDAEGNPQNYSETSQVSPLVQNALPALNQSSAAYTQNALSQNGADQTVPDVINQYMNPYNSAVTDQLATLGNRNLFENVLPGINSTFVGGGAFGGSRNNLFVGNAVRDSDANILAQQNSALQSGYNDATSAAQSDLSRLTGQAETEGTDYGNDLSRTVSGTQTLSDLLTGAGSADSARQTSAAQYLTGLGQTDANNALTASGALQNYGANVYNQNLKDASVLEGIGQTQQQQEQNEINAQVEQFNQAVNYPQQQLGTLESALGYLKVPTTTTTQSAPSTSPFGTALGGLLSLGSLATPGASGASALGNILGPAAIAAAKHGGSIKSPLQRHASGGSIAPWNGAAHTAMLMHKQIGRTLYQKPQSPLNYAAGGYVDHSSDTMHAVRGYADGGDVNLDDLLRQIGITPSDTDSSQPQAFSQPQSDFDKPGLQLLADKLRNDYQSAGDPTQNPDQIGFGNPGLTLMGTAPRPQIAQPQQSQSPLAMGRQADTQDDQPPAAFDASQVMNDPAVQRAVNQRLPIQQTSPISGQNPPQAQSLVQSTQPQNSVSPLSAGQPSAPPQNSILQQVQDLLKNNKNDMYRSALLKAGAALMGPGNFQTQLGAGVQAGANSLQEAQKNDVDNNLKLAQLQISQDDPRRIAALMHAQGYLDRGNTYAQNSDNKDAATTAKIAAQRLSQIDQTDPNYAAYKKIVDDYVGASGGTQTPGGGTLPGANIAKASASVALPPVENRIVGQVYTNPKGQGAIWTGSGWQPVGQ